MLNLMKRRGSTQGTELDSKRTWNMSKESMKMDTQRKRERHKIKRVGYRIDK